MHLLLHLKLLFILNTRRLRHELLLWIVGLQRGVDGLD